MSQDTGAPISSSEITSLREWLDTWGDGPNWSDATGRSVPMDKAQLRRLLYYIEQVQQLANDLLVSGSPVDYKPLDDEPGECIGYTVSPELFERLRQAVGS